MTKNTLAAAATVALLAALAGSEPALAQQTAEGWEAPARELIEALTGGLVKLGAGVVGIGIIAFALWAAVTGRIEWVRFGMIVIAGLLITVGPDMVAGILSVAG